MKDWKPAKWFRKEERRSPSREPVETKPVEKTPEILAVEASNFWGDGFVAVANGNEHTELVRKFVSSNHNTRSAVLHRLHNEQGFGRIADTRSEVYRLAQNLGITESQVNAELGWVPEKP